MSEASAARGAGPDQPSGQVVARGDLRGQELVLTSVKHLLSHQMPSGALLASRDFLPYQFCWLRDGSFVAFALDLAGERRAAESFHRWVSRSVLRSAPLMRAATERRDAGGTNIAASMPPARFTLDGDVTQDGWPNFQVDGYGTWLWSLLEHVKRWHAHELAEGMGEAVGLVSAYLQAVALDTCFDCWEENGDALHTSTLACTYGGLRAASALVGSSASSQAAGRRADDVQGLIAERAVLGGRFVKSSNDAGVDASLLWLAVPFGAAGPSSPAMTATAQAIEETLDLDGGTRRYQGDTYYGGGAWPLLTAWLGWYRAVTGDMAAAHRCEKWVEACFDTSGQLPEQLGGAQRDPASYSDWVGKWGPPAADLAWSHAMFLVLQDQLDEEAAPRSEGPSGTPQRNRQTNPTFLDSRGTSVTGQERG